MAVPPGYNYRAVRVVEHNGVRAYDVGHPVHESQVIGPDAWLKLGDDVEALPGVAVSRPAKNSSQAAWAEFAVAEGLPRDEAEGLSRADLIARYGDDAAAEQLAESGGQDA